MTIKWDFEWYSIDGRPVIKFDDWIDTLSSDEQTEYNSAYERQQLLQQEAVDQGILEIKQTNQYIWKDRDSEQVNKPNDPIWFKYWTRYQNETGTRCKIVKTEV